MISSTLDTNVYIRGLRTSGIAALILDSARAKNIRIDLSNAIVDETCGVLGENFQWDGYSIADAYQKMRAIGNLVIPSEVLCVIKEDPDDNRILECEGAHIITIRDFADIALRNQLV